MGALERLLQQKPRLVNSTAKHLGRTPLHVASWAGYADIARFLVQKGADVNATADGQWTADMGPMDGPVLGPYRLRGEALAAEVKWLRSHLGGKEAA